MTDDAVLLDGESLTPEEVEQVARHGVPVEIAAAARERVRESRDRVRAVLDTDEAVYGVNTGFGELVDQRISRSDLDDLQTNLVRSHAAGTGEELNREVVRALLVTRLNALLAGYSGVRETVVETLASMCNRGIHPVVYRHGSLGASGDLAPLAHVALVLLGEGEARVEPQDGVDLEPTDEPIDGGEALTRAGIEPLSLEAKEGLALINGTQLTVGIGALLVVDGERLLAGADVAGALTTEVGMGSTVPSAPVVGEIRPHDGQRESAQFVRELTADSEIVESHRNCDRVQDAYSLRCLPQVHGATWDAIGHLRDAVETELNSATDNPLIVPADAVDDRATITEDAAVLSAGNFHGAPLAHRLDYAVGAITDLAAISERRVDRLVNPNVQEPHLPPFLATNSGLESGLMIAQYTAASLVAQIRSTGRAGTDNTPVSGGQEDHVSMSATAAANARDVLATAATVVGIELLVAAEAAEYVDQQHGTGTGAAYDAVRAVIDPLDGDRPLSADIDRAAALVESGALLDRVETALENR